MSDPMIAKAAEEGYLESADGIWRKTLVYGEKTLLTEFRLQKGSRLPAHSHPHEQTGYLVSGEIILFLAGKRHEIKPGDSWSIPGDLEHSAEILADSVAVEVFSPVRDDFLPAKK